MYKSYPLKFEMWTFANIEISYLLKYTQKKTVSIRHNSKRKLLDRATNISSINFRIKRTILEMKIKEILDEQKKKCQKRLEPIISNHLERESPLFQPQRDQTFFSRRIKSPALLITPVLSPWRISRDKYISFTCEHPQASFWQ